MQLIVSLSFLKTFKSAPLLNVNFSVQHSRPSISRLFSWLSSFSIVNMLFKEAPCFPISMCYFLCLECFLLTMAFLPIHFLTEILLIIQGLLSSSPWSFRNPSFNWKTFLPSYWFSRTLITNFTQHMLHSALSFNWLYTCLIFLTRL